MSDEANAVAASHWVRRIQALALIAYGVLSVICVILTRGYTAEYGGMAMWWLSIAVGAIYLLLGLLLGVLGERVRWAVLVAVVVPFAASTLAPASGRQTPIALAGASLVAVACAVLLWPRAGRARLILGLAGVVVCALSVARKTADTLTFPPLAGPPVKLEIMLVDESACALVVPGVPETGGASAPVMFGTELVSGRNCSFVKFEARAGSTFNQARLAAEQWAAPRVKLPSGTRLAWGREDGEGRMVLRSYPIRERAVVTSADVSQAEAQAEDGKVSLAVSFESAAAERFRAVTREHVGERLAILLDGGVRVAPVIQTEIKGGHVLVSLVDTTIEQARGLAAALRGELLHAPIGWKEDVQGAP